MSTSKTVATKTIRKYSPESTEACDSFILERLFWWIQKFAQYRYLSQCKAVWVKHGNVPSYMVNNERDIEEHCEPLHGSDEEECKQNVDEVFRQNQLSNGHKNTSITQDFHLACINTCTVHVLSWKSAFNAITVIHFKNLYSKI